MVGQRPGVRQRSPTGRPDYITSVAGASARSGLSTPRIVRISPRLVKGVAMDRAILEQHLLQAESHVTLGEQHIARQREIVTQLERDGHGSTEARKLLALFVETQAAHIADVDRLQRQLADT